jgi:hypothetical protein
MLAILKRLAQSPSVCEDQISAFFFPAYFSFQPLTSASPTLEDWRASSRCPLGCRFFTAHLFSPSGTFLSGIASATNQERFSESHIHLPSGTRVGSASDGVGNLQHFSPRPGGGITLKDGPLCFNVSLVGARRKAIARRRLPRAAGAPPPKFTPFWDSDNPLVY